MDSTTVVTNWAQVGVALAEAIGSIGCVWAICWAIVKVKTNQH